MTKSRWPTSSRRYVGDISLGAGALVPAAAVPAGTGSSLAFLTHELET
jgi:hypothetical protein